MFIMDGFFVWDIDPQLFLIGKFPIKLYGFCWMFAFLLGVKICKWVAKMWFKDDALISPEYTEKYLVYILGGTAIGARLGHVLFYDFQYYSKHLLEIFLPIEITNTGINFVGFSGLASHGAAVGILSGVYLCKKKYGIEYMKFLDLMCISVPFGGALIRIGNFFNSEIIGNVTSVPWAIIFKKFDSLPRHPTQLYEALIYFLIALCAFFIVKKTREQYNPGLGAGFSYMMIFLTRIFVEFLKEPQSGYDIDLYATCGMKLGQILSVPFVLFFAFVFINAFKKRNININSTI